MTITNIKRRLSELEATSDPDAPKPLQPIIIPDGVDPLEWWGNPDNHTEVDMWVLEPPQDPE